MKTLTVGIVSAALWMAPALALEIKGKSVLLDKREVAECKAGECIAVNVDKMNAFLIGTPSSYDLE